MYTFVSSSLAKFNLELKHLMLKTQTLFRESTFLEFIDSCLPTYFSMDSVTTLLKMYTFVSSGGFSLLNGK